jgi:vancomycin resistance protein VanJ
MPHAAPGPCVANYKINTWEIVDMRTNRWQSAKWQAAKNIFKYTLTATAGAYVLSVNLFLLLRLLTGERFGFIGFFSSFVAWLLLPSILALIALIWLRRPRLALLCLPPLLVLIGLYGGRFVPRPASATADNQRLVILTHNIQYERDNMAELAQLFIDSDADIIAVQELETPIGAYLAEALREAYPHQALHATDNPTHGQGVFSRYPILEDEYWRDPDVIGNQRVLIDINGRQIAVYNVHPPHPGMTHRTYYDDSTRSRDISATLDRAARETVPVILMGDFNMGDFSEDYRMVTQQYADVFAARGQGFGFTFPNWHSMRFMPQVVQDAGLPPVIRLDYIFVSAAFAPLTAEVLPTSYSDHYALRVAVEW